MQFGKFLSVTCSEARMQGACRIRDTFKTVNKSSKRIRDDLIRRSAEVTLHISTTHTQDGKPNVGGLKSFRPNLDSKKHVYGPFHRESQNSQNY